MLVSYYITEMDHTYAINQDEENNIHNIRGITLLQKIEVRRITPFQVQERVRRSSSCCQQEGRLRVPGNLRFGEPRTELPPVTVASGRCWRKGI